MVRDGQRHRQTDGWKKWHIEVGAPPKNELKYYPISEGNTCIAEQNLLCYAMVESSYFSYFLREKEYRINLLWKTYYITF